ncbi:MAG: DUF2585 domain-containing protein [Chakrabartia sp.]
MEISRKYWFGVLAVFAGATFILLGMDRPLICTCGTVKLWEGVVNGPGNSQHISDWYSFSHVIHGFIFYGLGAWLLRTKPLGLRLIIACMLELAWEISENSPAVIDRYRQATMAVGYSGDSILNSISDGGCMMLGFFVASRLPWKITLGLAILFELFTLWMIRDNLTLNILMLVSPLDAVRVWQAGA